MSRLGLVLLSLMAILLGCTSTPLSPPRPARATARVPPAPPPPQPVPPPVRPSPPSAPEIVVTPLQPAVPLDLSKEIVPSGSVEPHVALLLPLKSRDYSRAAGMVREGFEAATAFETDRVLPVKIYLLEDEGDSLLGAY